MKKQKIAILGAGFTGLTAAYELTKKGYDVTVIEKESSPGGLASGFKLPNWQWPLERAYHHLFTSDWNARNLLNQIGMGDKLFFKRPITASLYTQTDYRLQTTAQKIANDQRPTTNDPINIYQLDSPLSLLKFPLLPMVDKIRTGIILGYLRLTPFWKDFEKTTAKEWLMHFMGEQSWKILWEPLLVGKFGPFADRINMAWFWARIKKRSPQLGYIKGGFQTFAETLTQEIIDRGGNVLLNATVTTVQSENNLWTITLESNQKTRKPDNQSTKFDIVLSTLPTPIFLKTTPQVPVDFADRLKSIPHLHAQTLILELTEPFLPPLSTSEPVNELTSKPYWLNIMDRNWPFLALVEHTNYAPSEQYGNNHIIYVGNYLPQGHEFFKKTKDELIELFLPYLKRLNPKIANKGFIKSSTLFVGPFAQPVIEINYSRICPPIETPIPGLYIGNLDSVYPWDRGTNYAIELGQKAAKLIIKKSSNQLIT